MHAVLCTKENVCGVQTLHACQMMRYDAKSGALYMTELGRIASHFYISHGSINTINENLKSAMTIQEVLLLIAECAEFESLKVRDEEMPDLEKLRDNACKRPLTAKEGDKPVLGNRESKVQVLIQVCTHHGISLLGVNGRFDSHSLCIHPLPAALLAQTPPPSCGLILASVAPHAAPPTVTHWWPCAVELSALKGVKRWGGGVVTGGSFSYLQVHG
jgi:hypothetical protein